MKPSSLIIVVVAVLLIIGTVYFRTGEAPSRPEGEKQAVAVTIYPLYDLARNVAGEEAEVKLILPPGASPHLFEFSPKQLKELQNVKAVFAIGHGLDDWAAQIANVVKDAPIITVDQGIDLRKFENGATDPHYWLHFGNARQITDTIAKELGEIDPAHADLYRMSAQAYKEKLAEKEDSLKPVLAQAQGKSILTFHEGWFYFAQNFGLKIAGTFEPAAGVEPTPRYLAALQREIKEKQIKIIFIEPQLSTGVLEGFAKDNHLSIAELDPLGGVEGRRTYLDLMEFNANAVRQALTEQDR